MAEMWDSVASAWERNAEFVDRHMATATERLLDAAGVGAGASVIEIACGPGGAGIAAAHRVGDEGSVILSDVAGEMVAAAQRRAAGLPQVRSLVCDQLSIDAPDATFDAAISRHGLMFAEPPADAVAEAARVLRPGGRYAAMVWDSREANPWLGCVLDAVGEQFGVPFPPPHIPGPFALGADELLRDTLTAGGLGEVTVERIATPMPARSLEEWWERVPELAGPLAQALAGMEPEIRDAIRERALAKGEAVATTAGDGVEFAGAVLIGAGRRA